MASLASCFILTFRAVARASKLEERGCLIADSVRSQRELQFEIEKN